MTRQEQKTALGLARGTIDSAGVLRADIPARDKAGILDLATEYLQYTYVKKEIPKDRYTALFLGLLQARSTLGNRGGLAA